MTEMIEIKSIMKKSDVSKMLITAMIFRSPLFIPLLLAMSYGFSFLIWKTQHGSFIGHLLLWIGTVFLTLFILLKKAISQGKKREEGGENFIGQTQVYRFYEDHFSYKAGENRDFLDIPYSNLRSFSARGGFLILYMGTNLALAIAKGDIGEKLEEILRRLRKSQLT
jgi:hypothetical protein